MREPPKGTLPTGNRVRERIEQHTGTDVEGAPEEEHLDQADVEERVDEDPDEQPNATDPESDQDPDPV
jgi:hypothetical protein